ncbi:hypothetical protein [Actinomadura sp. 9N407]|uniref:hypothetical protein n=1 Tax=Actinomadura sp. 9N407 TaxID=3375154 RepID=UPI0037A961D4
MRSPNPAVRVDQIVFVWSDRLLIGGSGLGPVATSLDPDGLRGWNERLVGGDVAVGQWHQGGAECVALGALRLGRRGDQGAVLRLLPARDPNGRVSQMVHALVGPAEAVDARLALGLHRWPKWITPELLPGLPASLPVLDAAELWAEAGPGLDALAVRREPLAGLLAGAIAAPADRYLADISPADLDLVAGLVRRLDGVAGKEPWTMMLGAEVTRAEARPRLLVLARDDARRDRTPLTTEAAGDPRLDRAAGLLADLRPESLTPPRSPLADPAALLDWAETEHQRASTVLDLIDRALAGTLDEDAHRHLDGPSGQERLRAELRHADVAALTERLHRWAAAPPQGLANAGRTLRGIAAERYLAHAGEVSEAPDHLAQAARRLGTPPDEAARVLVDWFAGLSEVTSTHRYAAVYFALWFDVDLTTDATIRSVLAGMPPADVLRWVAQLAPAGRTGAARHFVDVAFDRWRRARDQAGDERVRALLAETGMFHETIHLLVTAGDAMADEETQLYRTVLYLAYGAPIGDVGPVLAAMPVDAAATEFRPWLAVAAVVQERALVFQIAAHAFGLNAPSAVMEELLDRFSSTDLITGLADRPGQPGLLQTVCNLLNSRPPGIAERSANHAVLIAHHFLSEMVESAWGAVPERRFIAYTILLRAAYGQGDRAAGNGAGLTVPQVRELLALGGPPSFVWAVLDAASEEAVLPVLLDEQHRRSAAAGLSSGAAERALRVPHHRAVEVKRAEAPRPLPAVPQQDRSGLASAPTGTPPSLQYSLPGGGLVGSNGGTHPGDQPDRFPSDEKEPVPDDRNRALAFVADLDRNVLISVGIVGLAVALLACYLIFSGGSEDDPPGEGAVVPTVTVTVPAAPPTKTDRATPTGTDSATPTGDRTPEPTTGQSP